MHMNDYTIEERRLTDEEIKAFRESLSDDLAPARGTILGVAISFAAWAAFFGIVWTLINLPGIP
jgi:hypothetical protein